MGELLVVVLARLDEVGSVPLGPVDEIVGGGEGVEGAGFPEGAEVKHHPHVADFDQLRVAADRPGRVADVVDHRPVAEAAPGAEVVGNREADLLLAVGRGLAVVGHDKLGAERAGLVAQDGALVERGVLEIAGVGLGGGEHGILREAGPRAERGGIVAVGDADGERVGLVALERAAEVGEPVFALVGAELVRGAVPAGVVERESAGGLPGVPA